MERAGGAGVITPRPPFDPAGPIGRLAELVAHLSGCPAHIAVVAVQRALPAGVDVHDDLNADGRLALVAQAMVLLRSDLDLRDQRHRRPA